MGKQITGERKAGTNFRCPFYSDARLTEVSVLHRCPSYKGVHFAEVSVLQRCPSYRGVHLTE